MWAKLTGLKEWFWPKAAPIADTATSQNITKRVDFSIIRYSMVWEDSKILREGLATKPGDRLLSIAAAGDNGLALLLDDPSEVVMVDLSFPQIALCHLKMLSIKHFTQEETCFFLGFTDVHERNYGNVPETRYRLFLAFSDEMEEKVRLYWQTNIDVIKAGVCYVGKIEKYHGFFARNIMPLVHSRDTVKMLLNSQTVKEQEEIVKQRLNTWLWRLATRRYYGKYMLGRMGRDPTFLDGVDINISEHGLSSFIRGFSTVPQKDNFWMEYVLTGNISGNNGSAEYLTKENYAVIKSRLDRITLVEANLLDYLDEQKSNNTKFHGFNLSDIFEWLNEDLYLTFLDKLVASGHKGAKLVYWNFLKVRKSPESMRTKLRRLTEIEEDLHKRDRVFFYRAVRVERIE